MTAHQLKNSILQMAVQGRLVDQNPHDEPASELLKKIQAEKIKLVKEGKIKASKGAPLIYKKEGSYFEKVGASERCIDEEIPFNIPDSWEWVRFNTIVDYSMGKTPPRKENEYWGDPSHAWVSIADMVSNGLIKKTKEMINEYSSTNLFKGKKIRKGTLLMSFKLTVGKVSILDIDAFHNEAIISIYPFVDSNKVMTNYLFIIMPLLSQNGATKSAIKGRTLNSDSINNLLIPLPPLAEQQRIVDKIEGLLPSIGEYDKAHKEIESLNKAFPNQVKKSILQWAVQGRLVEQNPHDEPASELLKKIQAEKIKLVKEGKIKASKGASLIYKKEGSYFEKVGASERCIDEEIPFNIPDSWEWVRLGEIISLTSGQDFTPDKYNDSCKGIPYLTGASNIEDDTVLVNRWTKFPRSRAYKGDLLLTCKGTVGTMAFLQEKEAHIARQIMAISNIFEVNLKYIRYFLDSFVTTLKSSAKSMIPGISRADVLQIYIPLPPLAEQQRIVDKIEGLLKIITEIDV